MKRLLCLVLVGFLVVGMLTGCESNEKKMEALMGQWMIRSALDSELAKLSLSNIDLSEEEIALVDLDTLQMCTYVEYGLGTYRIFVDQDVFKNDVEAFLTGAFDNMYDNRMELNDLYSEDFSLMSRGEFQQYYADLYGFGNFTDLMDAFVEGCFDYSTLEQDAETGTYHIEGEKILRTIDGTSKEEYMNYQIDGDTLTLIYAEYEEVLIRVK